MKKRSRTKRRLRQRRWSHAFLFDVPSWKNMSLMACWQVGFHVIDVHLPETISAEELQRLFIAGGIRQMLKQLPRKSFQKECVCWDMRGSSGRSQEAERRSTGEDFVHHIFMKASECGNLPTFGTWNPCGKICRCMASWFSCLCQSISTKRKFLKVFEWTRTLMALLLKTPLGSAFGKCEPSRKSSLAVLGHTWLTCTYLLVVFIESHVFFPGW